MMKKLVVLILMVIVCTNCYAGTLTTIAALGALSEAEQANETLRKMSQDKSAYSSEIPSGIYEILDGYCTNSNCIDGYYVKLGYITEKSVWHYSELDVVKLTDFEVPDGQHAVVLWQNAKPVRLVLFKKQ